MKCEFMKILRCSPANRGEKAEWLEMVVARVEQRAGDCQMKIPVASELVESPTLRAPRDCSRFAADSGAIQEMVRREQDRASCRNPLFSNSTPNSVVRELFPHPDDTREAQVSTRD